MYSCSSITIWRVISLQLTYLYYRVIPWNFMYEKGKILRSDLKVSDQQHHLKMTDILLFMYHTEQIIYFASFLLLCWASDGGATNSPSHVHYMGVSYSCYPTLSNQQLLCSLTTNLQIFKEDLGLEGQTLHYPKEAAFAFTHPIENAWQWIKQTLTVAARCLKSFSCGYYWCGTQQRWSGDTGFYHTDILAIFIIVWGLFLAVLLDWVTDVATHCQGMNMW